MIVYIDIINAFDIILHEMHVINLIIMDYLPATFTGFAVA
jgi:hypothetical protein